MTIDNLSDYNIRLMRYLMYAYCYGFKPAIDFKGSLAFDREYLESIVKELSDIEFLCSEAEAKSEDFDLKCYLKHDQWWAFDPRYIYDLKIDEIKVIIIALEEACRNFDGDIETIIASYHDLQSLKNKLEALIIIKDYMFLQWSEFKYYRHLYNYSSPLNLKYLIYFFSTGYTAYHDYRVHDNGILFRPISIFDGNFVYNDLEHKMLYIGCAEWELDEIVKAPSLEEFPGYVNEINSCKISHDNFIELTCKIIKMKRNPPPFSVMYRDNSDWIRCKGFSSKEELELFPDNY